MVKDKPLAPRQTVLLGDVARIIAKRLAHQTLRLVLAGPVEEPEQIVNDGVGMHALGFHIRLQQPLRLRDQRILARTAASSSAVRSVISNRVSYEASPEAGLAALILRR